MHKQLYTRSIWVHFHTTVLVVHVPTIVYVWNVVMHNVSVFVSSSTVIPCLSSLLTSSFSQVTFIMPRCVCVLGSHSMRQQFTPSLRLQKELVNFGLGGLLSSYVVIFSPRRLLPAIQSTAKSMQIPQNWLLINMTVQSVQQIRCWPEWNPEQDCKSYIHSLSFA